MRTEAYIHNSRMRFVCPFCGHDPRANCASVRLISGDGEVEADTVCPECIKAGPVGAAARMRQTATEMRKDAAALLDLHSGEFIVFSHPIFSTCPLFSSDFCVASRA